MHVLWTGPARRWKRAAKHAGGGEWTETEMNWICMQYDGVVSKDECVF